VKSCRAAGLRKIIKLIDSRAVLYDLVAVSRARLIKVCSCALALFIILGKSAESQQRTYFYDDNKTTIAILVCGGVGTTALPYIYSSFSENETALNCSQCAN
jgi:hypothetical protein